MRARRLTPRMKGLVGARTVDIPYKENGVDKVHTWTYEKPDAIKVDERKGERFKPKINVTPAEYNTPFKIEDAYERDASARLHQRLHQFANNSELGNNSVTTCTGH